MFRSLVEIILIIDMARFSEYDVVRVVKLLEAERSITGSKGSTRQPKVGDMGAVVFVSDSSDFSTTPVYIVECVDDAGMTVWLADFQEDELEIVVYES